MRTIVRKRLPTLLVLVAVTVLGLPGVAAAKPESSTELSETCATQLAAVAAVAVTTMEEDGLAPCVEADPTAQYSTAVADPTCPKFGWFATRFRACSVHDYVLSVYTVRTRELKGRMFYSVRDEIKTTGQDSTWTHNRLFYELNPLATWGAARNSIIGGDARCSGDCRVVNGSMPWQRFPNEMNPLPTAQGLFESTISAARNPGYGTTTWRDWFDNPGWIGPSNVASETVPFEMRCDDALPGHPGTGCVFHKIRAIYTVGHSLTSYRKHISMALSYAMDRFLTRLTDPFYQTQNHNRACPIVIPRPDFYECDEYPFRSTWQGAYTGNHPWGRTFSGCQISAQYAKIRVDKLGWNICMIPEQENRQGGQELLAFYNTNRVIEAEQFEVSVS